MTNLKTAAKPEDQALCVLPAGELAKLVDGVVKKNLAEYSEKVTEQKLLSPSEACKLFYPVISRTTLSRWTTAGLLNAHSYGGRIYYKFTEILEAGKTLKKFQKPQTNL